MLVQIEGLLQERNTFAAKDLLRKNKEIIPVHVQEIIESEIWKLELENKVSSMSSKKLDGATARAVFHALFK